MVKEYLEETKNAMEWLGKQEDTIFLGQTVKYPGSPMYHSLKNVPMEKRMEIGIAEDMQMGMSIGLALEGKVPISIYPRMDFLLCAINQLVNHLDKVEEMSHGEFCAGVIIRTQIGNHKPLDPGPQHTGNYYQALKKLCKNIAVWKIDKKEEINKYYKMAYHRAKHMGKSTILIETPQGGVNPNKK
jgi:pyruvate/2-oxoglutarate/acetoin dehydrogenase E1 component